jgi:hypothetical protein
MDREQGLSASTQYNYKRRLYNMIREEMKASESRAVVEGVYETCDNFVREWFKKDFGSLTQAEYIYIVNAIRKLEYVIKGENK